MGSVSNTSFSIADLLHTVTGASSSEASAALSTPAVQAALQNASPGDTVALSHQAVQLQEATQWFGNSRAVEGATLSSMLYPLASAFYPLSSLLATLDTAPPATVEPGGSSSSESLANQLRGYQADLQSGEMQTLFGVTSDDPEPSALFNSLG